MKKITMFIFAIFIFTTASFGANSDPPKDKEKPVLPRGGFEIKLKGMTSVDQIFDYLGKPNSYTSYNITPSSLRFIIEYDWETINDAPVKIAVADKTGEYFYVKQLKIELIDELKEREELSKLGKPFRAKKRGQELTFKITKMEITPSPLWPTEFTQEERRKQEEKTQEKYRKLEEKLNVITNAFDVIKNINSKKANEAAVDEYISGIKESLIKGSGVVLKVAKGTKNYYVYILVDGTKTPCNFGTCSLNIGPNPSYVSVLKEGDKIEFSGRIEKVFSACGAIVLKEGAFNKK